MMRAPGGGGEGRVDVTRASAGTMEVARQAALAAILQQSSGAHTSQGEAVCQNREAVVHATSTRMGDFNLGMPGVARFNSRMVKLTLPRSGPGATHSLCWPVEDLQCLRIIHDKKDGTPRAKKEPAILVLEFSKNATKPGAIWGHFPFDPSSDDVRCRSIMLEVPNEVWEQVEAAVVTSSPHILHIFSYTTSEEMCLRLLSGHHHVAAVVGKSTHPPYVVAPIAEPQVSARSCPEPPPPASSSPFHKPWAGLTNPEMIAATAARVSSWMHPSPIAVRTSAPSTLSAIRPSLSSSHSEGSSPSSQSVPSVGGSLPGPNLCALWSQASTPDYGSGDARILTPILSRLPLTSTCAAESQQKAEAESLGAHLTLHKLHGLTSELKAGALEQPYRPLGKPASAGSGVFSMLGRDACSKASGEPPARLLPLSPHFDKQQKADAVAVAVVAPPLVQSSNARWHAEPERSQPATTARHWLLEKLVGFQSLQGPKANEEYAEKETADSPVESPSGSPIDGPGEPSGSGSKAGEAVSSSTQNPTLQQLQADDQMGANSGWSLHLLAEVGAELLSHGERSKSDATASSSETGACQLREESARSRRLQDLDLNMEPVGVEESDVGIALLKPRVVPRMVKEEEGAREEAPEDKVSVKAFEGSQRGDREDVVMGLLTMGGTLEECDGVQVKSVKGGGGKGPGEVSEKSEQEESPLEGVTVEAELQEEITGGSKGRRGYPKGGLTDDRGQQETADHREDASSLKKGKRSLLGVTKKHKSFGGMWVVPKNGGGKVVEAGKEEMDRRGKKRRRHKKERDEDSPELLVKKLGEKEVMARLAKCQKRGRPPKWLTNLRQAAAAGPGVEVVGKELGAMLLTARERKEKERLSRCGEGGEGRRKRGRPKGSKAKAKLKWLKLDEVIDTGGGEADGGVLTAAVQVASLVGEAQAQAGQVVVVGEGEQKKRKRGRPRKVRAEEEEKKSVVTLSAQGAEEDKTGEGEEEEAEACTEAEGASGVPSMQSWLKRARTRKVTKPRRFETLDDTGRKATDAKGLAAGDVGFQCVAEGDAAGEQSPEQVGKNGAGTEVEEVGEGEARGAEGEAHSGERKGGLPGTSASVGEKRAEGEKQKVKGKVGLEREVTGKRTKSRGRNEEKMCKEGKLGRIDFEPITLGGRPRAALVMSCQHFVKDWIRENLVIQPHKQRRNIAKGAIYPRFVKDAVQKSDTLAGLEQVDQISILNRYIRVINSKGLMIRRKRNGTIFANICHRSEAHNGCKMK